MFLKRLKSMSRNKIPWINVSKKMRDQILNKLQQYANNRKDIKMLVLYGSILRRDFIRDIDVAILVEENERDLLKLEFEIEEELEKILRMPVDVRLINRAPSWFIKKVIKEGLVLKGEEVAIAIYKKALDEIEGLRIKIKLYTNQRIFE